jgi:hypothetical protein
LTRRRPTAAAVVFALLVLATVAAFAYAQQKKRDPLIIDRVEFAHRFTPVTAHCAIHSLRIKFRTTTSNDATIQVVKPGGKPVATLVRGRFLKRYSYHVLHWDGTGDTGVPVPSGNYRLRARLEDEDRTLVLPSTIRVHETPPPEGVRCFRPTRAAGQGKSS